MSFRGKRMSRFPFFCVPCDYPRNLQDFVIYKIFVRKVSWNLACLFWYRLSSSTITSPKSFWFKLSTLAASWLCPSIISSSFLSSVSWSICSSGSSKSPYVSIEFSTRNSIMGSKLIICVIIISKSSKIKS